MKPAFNVTCLLVILTASISLFKANNPLYEEEPGGWNYNLLHNSSCKGTVDDKCGVHDWDKVKDPALTNSCGGRFQSPVDIQAKSSGDSNFLRKLSDSAILKLNSVSECHGWNQYVSDHAFTVSFAEPGIDTTFKCDSIWSNYRGIKYTLKNIHFHSPSEHTLKGKHYDAEVHFVHKNDQGNLLVMGILLNTIDSSKSSAISSADKLLHEFYEEAAVLNHHQNHRTEEDIVHNWEVNSFIGINPYNNFINDHNKRYYTYTGSLTTYPCTENVTWVIFEEPADVTMQDLNMMNNAVKLYPYTVIDNVGGNSRPIQSLNGRVVTTNVAIFV